MAWKQLLASITRSVDEELRLYNAYLVTENRILRQQITGRVPLSDGDRLALAEIGQKLGRQLWKRSRQLPSQTLSSPGIANVWPSRVTAHSRTRLSDVPASTRS